MAGTIANLIVNVQANTASLQTIDKDVKKIESSLSGFEKSIGKVGAMLAGAFTVTAIVSAGQQLLDFAGKMTDLAAKTGVSTTTLQKWSLAFEQSGVSIDTVTKASSELAAKLVNGDKSVVSALQKMGLSVDDLKRMKPEDQFTTVADAVGKLQNKGEQLYASKTLFGKSGVELLAGLTGNLKETTDEFERMGLIIDEQTIKAADDFGDQLGLMGKQLLGVTANAIAPLLPALSALAEGLAFVAKIAGTVLGMALKGVTIIIAGLWAGIAELLGWLADLAQKIPGVGKHLGFLADASDWLHKSAAKSAEMIEKLALGNADVGNAATKAVAPLLGMGDAADRSGEKADAAAKKWEALKRAAFSEDFRGMSAAAAGGHFFGTEQVPKSAEITPWLKGQHLTGRALMYSRPVPIQNPGVSQPPGFFGSMAGGIGGSLKSMWQGMSGGQGMAGLFSNIGSGILTGGLNSLMNTGLNLAMKGIGKLFGGLFGGGEGKKVNDARDSWVTQFTGMSDKAGGQAALRKMAEEAGIASSEINKLFSTSKMKDFEAGVASITAKLSDFNKIQADGQNAALQKQEMLNAAVERYGFTLEELGPTMQKQALAEKAEQLLNDFKLLTESGINIDTVIERMGDSINDFVRQAMKTGTEIPESMRGMLEKMIEQGRLTDEAGNKLASLETLTFGETLEAQFSRVLEKIEAMIDALNRIPRSIDITTNVGGPSMPSFDPSDGSDLPGFKSGTGGRYPDFGAGTPVMLHGRERVMPEAEGRAEARGLAALADRMAAMERGMRRRDERLPIVLRDALRGT